jgi:GAF domain-containing protein/CheY-like chemotaxis protein/anti-sigma regulatory factor (Ser/Thr protein kinase)
MSSKEVLIVEDEPDFRTLIKRALRVDNYSFLEADSVETGLKFCADRQGPSVILLDLDLPGGGGQTFLRGLGTDFSKFRIIILTAHEEYLAAELAREFQVFRYLHKPAKIMESLRFTVSQAFNDLERSHLKDKNEYLNEIQAKINKDIQESTSKEDTEAALKDVLKLICESARKLIGAYTIHIRVYDLKSGDFHLVAFDGEKNVLGKILNLPKKKNEPLTGTVANAKRSITYEELQREEVFKQWKVLKLNRIKKLRDAQFLKDAEEYFEMVESAYLAHITTGLFADETDAVFNVSADSIGFFTQEKKAVIDEFVGHATTAITKAWQKLRKQESHQDYRNISKVLEDISKTLRNENVKPEIYDIAVRGIAEIIRPEAISIYLYNKTTKVLDNEAEFRGNERQLPSIEGNSTDKGLTALVYMTGKPLRLPNLQSGDRREPSQHTNASSELYKNYVSQLPSQRVDHYLAVPMIIGDEVIGAIQLLNKKSAYYKDKKIDRDRWLLERGFSDDCENELGIAASHLAVAIKNAELLEERSKQISQLDILKDAGRYTTSWKTLDPLLEKIISQAAKETRAELCLLFLVDDSGKKVVLAQRYGITEKELPEASYGMNELITGNVIATRKPRLYRNDIDDGVPEGKYDKQILGHLQKTYGTDKQIESVMIVPIMGESKVLGAIKIINKKGDNPYYDDDDLKFFIDFASYVGLAIENTQHYVSTTRKLVAAESNATLSNLVKAVAHEVNHTLGLIPDDVVELQALLPELTPAQEEIMQEISRLATEIVYFTNEISGYRIGETATFNINEILEYARHQIPQFRAPANIDDISISPTLCEEPLLCLLDEGRLTRTIRNILINAYQALEGKEQTWIHIRTYKDAEAKMAMVEIADNGCGIKEEHLSRIFEPHFTTKAGKGTGIGLWLVKTYMDSISGTYTVSSVVNQGTTFTLGIPLQTDSDDGAS